jgi:undecaprenyl diphosphate synthase
MIKYKDMIDISSLPKHVVIIPDGNRRWARARGLPTFEGHRRGFDAATKIIEEAWRMGIAGMTLWGFSTENWDREENEISALMKIFSSGVDAHLKSAMKHKARIVHLGRKDRLNSSLLQKIGHAENETRDFIDHYLSIALDYGGRDEIIRAIQKMATDKNLDMSKLEPSIIQKYLDTALLPHPDPDLIIRTGGEQRTSGFMVWQNGYAELMFVEKFLPDFTVDDFKECIEKYQNRERRFGK